MTDKPDGKHRVLWAWIAYVPILFVAYMGAYYVSASPSYVIFYSPAPIYSGLGKPHLAYRFGGTVAEKIFAPAHEFDRRVIRPNKWSDPPQYRKRGDRP